MLPNKTSLNTQHRELNAKMVDFHGWEMPLHYGSQIEEHHAVRKAAGMFDVSHMTIVDVVGAGGRFFLRQLLTNDIDQLKHMGCALYTCMCNTHGGIIDDLIVYQRSPDNYRLVLNSATRAPDLSWIRQQIQGFSAGLQERHDLSMIAIQGPDAIKSVLTILTPAQADVVSTLAPFECIEAENCLIARTGYTGEDGLEVMATHDTIQQMWKNLIAQGIKPCGLAARDTLRLEAGMLLYGQDMDLNTTPLESALGWTIKWQPEDRNFIGMGALLSQKQHGIARKLVGLTLQDKGIMRHGQRVVIKGQPDGIITSGTYSPTLNQSIAFARVPVETSEQVMVDIRGKLIPATVGKLKFLNANKDK